MPKGAMWHDFSKGVKKEKRNVGVKEGEKLERRRDGGMRKRKKPEREILRRAYILR